MTAAVAPPTAGRALAVLGGSSIVTIAAGILSAKVAALLIGPSGVGLVGLIQGVSAVIAVLIEIGLAAALVRAYGGSGEAVRGRLTDLGSSARKVVLLAGIGAVGLTSALAPLLARPLLGADRNSLDLVFAALAAVPVALTVIENGLMVAAHRVNAVARSAISVAFISPIVSLLMFSVFDESGVGPAAVISASLVWSVTSTIRRRELAPLVAEESTSESRSMSTGRLLRDGIPVMASGLIGAATVLVLPLIVEGRLGREGVGYYRAATVISVGYTAIVLAVTGSDFLPRVTRVRSDAAAVRLLSARQTRLLVGAFVPVLCAIGSVLPLAVTVLYRRDFDPAVSILEWQLIGDVFRLSGSVLATALFARYGGAARFATEAVAFAFLLGLSYFGLSVDGVRGLGWGFIAGYVLYFFPLWFILGMHRGGAEARRAMLLVMAGSIVVAVPPVAAQLADGDARARLIGLPLALAWGLVAIRAVRRPSSGPAGV